MYTDIPFAEFHISERLQGRLQNQASDVARLALASGASCENEIEKISLMIVLTGDPNPKVAELAQKTLRGMGADRISRTLPGDTHPQLLRFLSTFFDGNERLDERLVQCINLPEDVARNIAQRCSARVCEEIARAQQLMLLNPQLIFDLNKNPNCPSSAHSRAESFLRMQGALPTEEVPLVSESRSTLSSSDVDLEAEIMAAINGAQSPSLMQAQSSFEQFSLGEGDEVSPSPTFEGFQLSKENALEGRFSFSLDEVEGDQEEEEEQHLSWEKKIKDMSVGHKIKLAFKGNKECRSILIRDSNKTVAVAVVKSGRLSDGEVATFAGNRNLSDDVIREIARNNEFIRKYPVKVALINNPKTPVATALSFLSSLHKKDLNALMRNRNVSSVISTAARKRFKDKFRKA